MGTFFPALQLQELRFFWNTRQLHWSWGGRYVLIIHFYVESGQKMIQFNIQFKVESKIFIQKIIQFKKFKNYSKIIQFKKLKKLFIQIGKIIPAWENSENMQNGPFFSSKRTCYSFFLWISHFFYSFKNSFNSTAKIFIQRIYSFNSTAKNSFKEFIHSKNNLIIHSMKI